MLPVGQRYPLLELAQQENEKLTLSKHMTGCVLENYVPSVDQGTYLRKDISCYESYRKIRSYCLHMVLDTHGDCWFSTRNSEPSCGLLFTGTTESFLIALCVCLSCSLEISSCSLAWAIMSHQPVYVIGKLQI